MNVRKLINQTIFSGLGELKKCGIHWDLLGNSRGTADIVYFNKKDAIAAVEKLNGKFVIIQKKLMFKVKKCLFNSQEEEVEQ